MSPSAARRRQCRAPIVAALALILLVLPTAAGAAVTPRASLPTIEPQVMCVTCKIPLNVAESPQANRERAFIQKLIDEGKDTAEIKDALVGQYGQSVLGLPRARGFNLVVYLVPVAVVLTLLALMVVLLPRWRDRARAAREGPARAAAPLSASDAARLESDLARFD